MLAFLDPYQHPQTIGYHMIQSMVAVANGHVSGTGLGHGLQKFDFLPEDQTDFIRDHLRGARRHRCVLVLVLIGALIWNAVAIARSERWPVLRLFALGVAATVGFQAVINLKFVVTAWPDHGHRPLLLSSRHGWLLTAASLGLVDRDGPHAGEPPSDTRVSREDLLALLGSRLPACELRTQARDGSGEARGEAAVRESCRSRGPRACTDRGRGPAPVFRPSTQHSRSGMHRANAPNSNAERAEPNGLPRTGGARTLHARGPAPTFGPSPACPTSLMCGGPARFEMILSRGPVRQRNPVPSMPRRARPERLVAEPATGLRSLAKRRPRPSAVDRDAGSHAMSRVGHSDEPADDPTTPGEQGWPFAQQHAGDQFERHAAGPDPLPA